MFDGFVDTMIVLFCKMARQGEAMILWFETMMTTKHVVEKQDLEWELIVEEVEAEAI